MNTVGSILAGAVLTFLIWLTGATLGDVMRDKPAGLRLLEIGYEDGVVFQHHEVFGRDAIIGQWAAKITRDGLIVCSGAGGSTYRGKRVAMTPTVWTGDDCPPLKPGDVAEASWEWTGNDGVRQSISAEFMIGDQG